MTITDWIQALSTVALVFVTAILCGVTLVYARSAKATEGIIRRNSEEQRRRQQIMADVVDQISEWGDGLTLQAIAQRFSRPQYTLEDIKSVLPDLLATGAVIALGYRDGVLYKLRIRKEDPPLKIVAEESGLKVKIVENPEAQ